MPGSPVMVRMAPLPSAIASQASSSTVSSASRPTSATWRRMWAGPRSPVTRKARTDRSTPFSSTSPSSSSSKQACSWRAVSGPMTTPPSASIVCSRAATLTVSPSAL